MEWSNESLKKTNITYGAVTVAEDKIIPLVPSYRFLVTVMSLFGLLCSLAAQGAVGAALLLMTPEKSRKDGNSSISNSTISEWENNWDKTTQGWVLSSFFIGYYVMQFPVGWLMGRYGGKRVILLASLFEACSLGVSIGAARLGYVWYSVMMAVAGMLNGLIGASVVDVLARWSPPHESSRIMHCAFSGIGLGITAVYCLTSLVSHLDVWGGWPFLFLILCFAFLVFCCLWAVLVTDTPQTNSWISDEEQAYILKSLSASGNLSTTKGTAIPWRSILTSVPVYAVGAAQFGTDWMIYSMITVTPDYFKSARKMSNSTVGLLCGLPWAAMPVVGYAVSRIIDALRVRDVSTSLLRKMADAVAKPLSASVLLVMTFLPDDSQWEVMLLYTIAVVLLTGFFCNSWVANEIDLSPRYAGSVAAVSQAIAMLSSFIAPLVTETMTMNDTPEEWRCMAWVTFAIACVSFLIYCVFGSSERQEWGPQDTSILVNNSD